MQLFVCTRCNCVDHVELAFSHGLPRDPGKQLCTKCSTGSWHGRFPYATYNPYTDMVINRNTGISLG